MTIKLPSVLSVQRGTIVTDGLMFSILNSSDGKEKIQPVRVIRHGIRGINTSKKKDEVANIQRTESAKTSPHAHGLLVKFNYRTIDARTLVFACADAGYRTALNAFIERFFQLGVAEFDEVCRRYARNILNGRWLWRNTCLGTRHITVKVGEATYQSLGSKYPHFENYTDDEQALAKNVIASGLLGNDSVHAQVEGRVRFGFEGEVEVFPSQNMVTNKPKGFARSLYKVDMIARRDLMSIMATARKDGEDAGEFTADMIDMGQAALRDQKIGNAIRTIDTWYPDCKGMPVAIEPNGASLEHNQLFRKDRSSGSKDLLTKIADMKPEAAFNPDAAYLIALLIRGGVFSESA